MVFIGLNWSKEKRACSFAQVLKESEGSHSTYVHGGAHTCRIDCQH